MNSMLLFPNSFFPFHARYTNPHQRFVKSLGDNAVTVLGNHDLHLLALFCGLRPPGKDPTLDPILEAPDAHALIHWLLQQPLLHREGNFTMVHAGLHREWSIDTAAALAKEIESQLSNVGHLTESAPTINPDTDLETETNRQPTAVCGKLFYPHAILRSCRHAGFQTLGPARQPA